MTRTTFILYLPIKHKNKMYMAYRLAGQKDSKSCSYIITALNTKQTYITNFKTS